MKWYLLSVVAVAFCFSCGEAAEEDAFRAQIDQAKKELADTDFSAAMYGIDSSSHWKVWTQTTQHRAAGKRTTSFQFEFKQAGKQMGQVTKDFDQRFDSYGQVFDVDTKDSVGFYLLLRDEQGAGTILRVACKRDGVTAVDKLDSTTSAGWLDIKARIEERRK